VAAVTTKPTGSPDEAAKGGLAELTAAIVTCRACPRLVAWREEVAATRRPAFADEEYWARPLPGFGDPRARLLVVGLAPAAHGGNRTGRMFTGDRSGDFLFAALHRAGFANQPESRHRDDGLALVDCYVTAPVRCAPPDNRPTPAERVACAPFLEEELTLLDQVRVVLVLGAIAYEAIWRARPALGDTAVRPRPRFVHGLELALSRDSGAPLHLLATYHPSQRNVFTGLLTTAMFDAVVTRGVSLLRSSA
jgi:uracil-DNA glycosylase family 4